MTLNRALHWFSVGGEIRTPGRSLTRLHLHNYGAQVKRLRIVLGAGFEPTTGRL